MNAFVTIAFRKDNKAEIICQPTVPYKEQKAVFHKINADFSYIEIWSKNSGIIKRKRIKESSNIPKISKISNETKQEPLKLESKENEQK